MSEILLENRLISAVISYPTTVTIIAVENASILQEIKLTSDSSQQQSDLASNNAIKTDRNSVKSREHDSILHVAWCHHSGGLAICTSSLELIIFERVHAMTFEWKLVKSLRFSWQLPIQNDTVSIQVDDTTPEGGLDEPSQANSTSQSAPCDEVIKEPQITIKPSYMFFHGQIIIFYHQGFFQFINFISESKEIASIVSYLVNRVDHRSDVASGPSSPHTNVLSNRSSSNNRDLQYKLSDGLDDTLNVSYDLCMSESGQFLCVHKRVFLHDSPVVVSELFLLDITDYTIYSNSQSISSSQAASKPIESNNLPKILVSSMIYSPTNPLALIKSPGESIARQIYITSTKFRPVRHTGASEVSKSNPGYCEDVLMTLDSSYTIKLWSINIGPQSTVVATAIIAALAAGITTMSLTNYRGDREAPSIRLLMEQQVAHPTDSAKENDQSQYIDMPEIGRAHV